MASSALVASSASLCFFVTRAFRTGFPEADGAGEGADAAGDSAPANERGVGAEAYGDCPGGGADE